MPRLAFIVEGHQEQKIIQSICPGSPVIRLNINGDSVSCEAIASRVSTLSRPWFNRFYPIVIIFDRERRQETCEEIEGSIRSILAIPSEYKDQFIFCVIDRTIESWIIPFVDDNGKILSSPLDNSNYEGQNVVGELTRRLRKSEIFYDKTTTGVEIFCGIDPVCLSSVSISFSALKERLQPHCGWLHLR
jgi:hypothetical protein